jgi:hypothetical protein
VLLVQGRWKALGAFVATGIGLTALSVAAVGATVTRTSLLLPFGDQYQQGVQLDQAWQMQGVTALLTTLLPGTWASVGQLLGSVLAATLVLTLLVRVARHRGDRSGDPQLWALVAVVTVLASPHVLDYDLVVLFPAVLVALAHRGDVVTRLALFALFVITWTIPIRHGLATLVPWPLTALGAAWSAVPLAFLAWRLSGAGPGTEPKGSGSPSEPHPRPEPRQQC